MTIETAKQLYFEYAYQLVSGFERATYRLWLDITDAASEVFPDNVFEVLLIPGRLLGFIVSVSNAIDAWISAVTGIVPRAIATAVVRQVELPKRFSQQVITREQAMREMFDAVLVGGLNAVDLKLPFMATIWLFFKTRVGKWKFIINPSWAAAWSKLITAVILRFVDIAFVWVRVVGSIIVIGMFIQILDETRRELRMPPLSQRNPRLKVTARIRRRIGGVKP